eukprot:2495253-Rhodomonas_salina.1
MCIRDSPTYPPALPPSRPLSLHQTPFTLLQALSAPPSINAPCEIEWRVPVEDLRAVESRHEDSILNLRRKRNAGKAGERAG